jgi:hypothetical protein
MHRDPAQALPWHAIRGDRLIPRAALQITAVLLGLGCLVGTSPAVADAYGITHPGQHIHYYFELEPEVIIVFGRNLDEGPGLGVRGSIPVMFNGFIPSINNIAVTFGFDKDPIGRGQTYNVPMALQWNFWLHRNFSVFGEPGVFLQFRENDKTHLEFQVWGGARVHFNDYVGLTARVSLPNTPAASLGVSFFF